MAGPIGIGWNLYRNERDRKNDFGNAQTDIYNRYALEKAQEDSEYARWLAGQPQRDLTLEHTYYLTKKAELDYAKEQDNYRLMKEAEAHLDKIGVPRNKFVTDAIKANLGIKIDEEQLAQNMQKNEQETVDAIGGTALRHYSDDPDLAASIYPIARSIVSKYPQFQNAQFMPDRGLPSTKELSGAIKTIDLFGPELAYQMDSNVSKLVNLGVMPIGTGTGQRGIASDEFSRKRAAEDQAMQKAAEAREAELFPFKKAAAQAQGTVQELRIKALENKQKAVVLPPEAQLGFDYLDKLKGLEENTISESEKVKTPAALANQTLAKYRVQFIQGKQAEIVNRRSAVAFDQAETNSRALDAAIADWQYAKLNPLNEDDKNAKTSSDRVLHILIQKKYPNRPPADVLKGVELMDEYPEAPVGLLMNPVFQNKSKKERQQYLAQYTTGE